MQNVKNLIKNLQSEGLAPEALVEALKDRGFQVREATADQDWQLKAPGQIDWVNGADLVEDGSLAWTALQRQHNNSQQQPQDQQAGSNDTSPDAVQRALQALMDLMHNMMIAVQNMVAKLANEILRACGVDYQIALMPGGKPAALQVKSDQVDAQDDKGAIKALGDVAKALQTNDADLLPQAPLGESEAAQARADLTQYLAFEGLRLTPDELVGIARRTAVQASSVARPGEQQDAIAAAAQTIVRQVKQYKFDPSEVRERLRQLQVDGAQQIQKVADRYQDEPLKLQAREMTDVVHGLQQPEMKTRVREMSV